MNRITLVVNDDIEWEGFTSTSIKKDADSLSGTFNISLTPYANKDKIIIAPIFTGNKIELYINDKPVINGYIDDVNISYTDISHSISISGRDKSMDLIDSSVVRNLSINAPYSLNKMVNAVLKNIGLENEIKVLNEVGNIQYEENFETERGANLWQSLNKYLQKKSIYATTDYNGNIVLFQGNRGDTNISLFNTLDRPTNIKSANFTDSYKQRFNKISVISQSPSIFSFGEFANQGGEKYSIKDNNIRASRQLEFVPKVSLTSEECLDLAKFERNIRKIKGQTYSCVVQGFEQTKNGKLWEPLYLVEVEDIFMDINDNLLIKSVEFTQDIEGGSLTTLGLVSKDAYTLVDPTAIQEKTKGDTLEGLF